MSYLISNIPQFKCWVRKEFTANHQKYHGEYLHALAIAVNTIPDRSLSFQVVFTGCETDLEGYPDENIHGGAMWARMPIEALVADITFPDWPKPMEDHLAQPWDCLSHHHSVVIMDRVSSSPWICKIGGEFYTGTYMFTVDYTENSIADDSAQHVPRHYHRPLRGDTRHQARQRPRARCVASGGEANRTDHQATVPCR